MAQNPKKSTTASKDAKAILKKKMDPLGMKGTKHGIKVSAKGEIAIPDDLYDKHRPEDFPKNIEKRVDQHRAKFMASVITAASEDIRDKFTSNTKIPVIEGKAQLAYRGNNATVRVHRSKTYSMGDKKPIRAVTSVTMKTSFKTVLKTATTNLTDISRKIPIN